MQVGKLPRCGICSGSLQDERLKVYHCGRCATRLVPLFRNKCRCRAEDWWQQESDGCPNCYPSFFYAVLGIDEASSTKTVKRAIDDTIETLKLAVTDRQMAGKQSAVLNEKRLQLGLLWWQRTRDALIHPKARATYDAAVTWPSRIRRRIEKESPWGSFWGGSFIIFIVFLIMTGGPDRWVASNLAPGYSEEIVGYQEAERCQGDRLCENVMVPEYDFSSTNGTWNQIIKLEFPSLSLLTLGTFLSIAGVGRISINGLAARLIVAVRIRGFSDQPARTLVWILTSTGPLIAFALLAFRQPPGGYSP